MISEPQLPRRGGGGGKAATPDRQHVEVFAARPRNRFYGAPLLLAPQERVSSPYTRCATSLSHYLLTRYICLPDPPTYTCYPLKALI